MQESIIGGSENTLPIGSRRVNVHLPDSGTDREPFPHLLSELQQAVAAEVAATQAQAATFRAEVMAGTLLTESDNGCRYTFLLSSLLPIPDDTPGELHIGSRRHACHIVAVQGLRVSLLLATAPARFIERATLVAQPWVALSRLHAALEQRAGESTTAQGLSAALFGGPAGAAAETSYKTSEQDVAPLDEAQRAALATALQHPVAAIAGPAHSGKTRLLSSIAAACLESGARVLILAAANGSVDSVLRTLAADSAGPAYAAGEMLRSGCGVAPDVRRAYPLLAPEQAENRLRAELEQETAAQETERTALTERLHALSVLQKAVELAQRATEERAAVQAEVDALLARQEDESEDVVETSSVQFLKERWRQMWQHAKRLTGRSAGGFRQTYREDAERQRQEAYAYAQQLAEAQRRLDECRATAQRLHTSVREQLAQYDLTTDSVDAACADTATRLRALEKQHAGTLADLNAVPRAARARARLVGCTLTHALVAETLAPESFDVVLIDDAHAIPLPHLFWAAGLARSRLVVTTEEAALPPWHCAQLAVARRWLGRSFAAFTAGMSAQPALKVVNLTERYGLHAPTAEAVARWFSEAGEGGRARLLRASERLEGPRRSVRRRLPARGHTLPLDKALDRESPLILVDTGTVKPWCEAIPREGRVNLASALATVALAARLRAAEPTAAIALVTPYAAQARLLLHVARDRELPAAVGIFAPPCLPGRAADIVIVDTVETPGAFAWSALDDSRPDSQAYALFSGVFTQARQRIFIVAHWKHVRDTFGARALLRRMLEEAVQAKWAVSAAELVRSERAGAIPRMAGAPSRSDGTRKRQSGGTTGWRLLAENLQAAERRVTVWSPHLALTTVEHFLSWLPSALLERGAVRLVTLPSGQRGGQSTQSAEARLVCEQMGVRVEERSALAANLVIVDDRLAWDCTFSPLGANSRGAEMRRIENAHVVGVLRRLLAAPVSGAVTEDVTAFLPFTGASTAMENATTHPADRALP